MPKDVTPNTALQKLGEIRETIDSLVSGDTKEMGEALIKIDDLDIFDLFDHIDYCLQRYSLERDHIREFLLEPENTSQSSVKMEWSLGHFDGPVSGIATVKNPMLTAKTSEELSINDGELYKVAGEVQIFCYFRAIGNLHTRYPRIYFLYQLTPEEFKKEQELNEYRKNGKWEDFLNKQKSLDLPRQREECKKRRPLGFFVR